MARGVKIDPSEPVEIGGVMFMVPDEESEYFLNDDSLELPAARPPSTVQTGPTTGVYFVRGGGLVKIGLARCVRVRLRGLRAVSPVSLDPVGYLATPNSYKDAFALERQLHERFSASRAHHEWFDETPELLAFMRAHLAAWPA